MICQPSFQGATKHPFILQWVYPLQNPNLCYYHAKLNALIQQFQGKQQRDKSNNICHHCGQKGHWANECPDRANVAGSNVIRGCERNNVRRPGRGGPGHRCPPLQAGHGGGGRGHHGRVGCTGARNYAPWRLVAPTNPEEQKYVNGRWFKFNPAASPPRWNVVRMRAPANNQANVLEFDPAAWMTEIPDHQAWANVIHSVPTYSTMGTPQAVASSTLIHPRPLVKTVEDEEDDTVGELIAAAELDNATLPAPSAATNLPTSHSIRTAHVPSQRHHHRPSPRACQKALSANNELQKAHARASQHPRVFKPRPTGWKPKRAAKRERFQKRMRHYRDTHRTTHISQPRTKRDGFPKCTRHYRDIHHTSPRVFRTPWRPSAPTSSRISHSEPSQNSFCGHLGLTYLLPLIWVTRILQPFCWSLAMVSRGQPSSMFLQHQAVARWAQAFLALPAVASWLLAAYLVGNLFRFFEQFSPSDASDPHPMVSSFDPLDPSFPQHHRAPTRPPQFLATSVFHKPPRRFSPAHGGATSCGFHPRYPLRLRTTPPPYRCPPRLPSPIVSSFGCPFLLLKSHLASFFGWLSCQVGFMWGWSSSSSSFPCPAPARRPNLSSGAGPSSQHRLRRHPLAPRHRRYFLLNLASRHDKRWLGRRQHVQAYHKFAVAHHLCDITTNMASLTTAEDLHAILQALTKLRDTIPKDGSFPIIWDPGDSISVTNDKADFLTFTKVSPHHNKVMGVAQGLKFSRFGEVLWSFLDEKGTLRSFKLPSLYIPSATTHLLSTTSLLQSYSGELIQQTGRGMRLSGTSDGQ